LIPVAELPRVNAALNALAAVLLVAGFACIRAKKVAAHRACMVAAFATSVAFLASYVYYHAHVGSVPFQGRGPVRAVYFTILISHVTLAFTVVPLALTTLVRAARGDFARHKRIARVTLPVWLYVSVTGVVVYYMLYVMPGGR
jgi:putative membrane protein